MSRRKRMMDNLDRDIRDFIERETQDNIERGMPPEEARYAALRKFGNVARVKEETREVWTILWIEQLLQDGRHAFGLLRRSPTFAGAAVLTLALGIGVNTSVFSLLYSLAVRPLPVKDAASVVNVYENFRGHFRRGVHGSPYLLSYPEYANFRDGNRVFAGLAAYAGVSLSLRGATSEEIAGLLASCNYFSVLGGDIARGRGLSPEDCRTPGQGSVAVISDGFWKRVFGSDPAVLGKTLALNRQVFTIVGVAAGGFSGTELQTPDVWLPLSMAPQLLPNIFKNANWLALENVSWLNVVGRLKPGISHRRAESELGVLAHQMDANYPGRQTTVSVNSAAYFNNPEMRSVGAWVATAILALAGFILVIACVNVASLFLARATARYQEIGIRLALGASRMRLVRHLLTETLLLALMGGAAGLVVARWLPPLLVSAVPEMPVTGCAHIDLTPDLVILAYAFLASLLAAVACGLVPAFQATRLELVPALKEEGSAVSRGMGRSRLRSTLIVTQVAGCTVLLVMAGLLVRGLRHAESTGPGFFTKNVILISLDLANQGYDEARATAFERDLHDRLAALPTVVGVARAAVVPCLAGNMTSVTIPGSKAGESQPMVWENAVSAEYFRTLGIHLLRGRIFTDQETQSRGVVPAVISAVMARQFWGNADPLGKVFVAGARAYRVLGIAPDLQNSNLGQTDGPFFYAAIGSESALDAKIFVRITGDPSAVVALVPQMARQLNANVLATTETFEEALEKILAPSRTLALLVTVLGILATVVAVVGVWGIVAYAASRRTHEMGIRKALGAHPRNILALLLGQGARLAIIGLILGLALGAATSQLLLPTGLLFGLSAFDPATYLTITIGLFSITLLGCYAAARRVTKVDPMVALRYE